MKMYRLIFRLNNKGNIVVRLTEMNNCLQTIWWQCQNQQPNWTCWRVNCVLVLVLQVQFISDIITIDLVTMDSVMPKLGRLVQKPWCRPLQNIRLPLLQLKFMIYVRSIIIMNGICMGHVHISPHVLYLCHLFHLSGCNLSSSP